MTHTNPLGVLDAQTAAGVVAAASAAGYEDWWGRVRSSGYCAHPIHLIRTTPTGTTTVYARCENRRETVCPACSDLYALDTWHIVTGGLTPDATANAVTVFITLTAPSFGPVHTHHAKATPCGAIAPTHCRHTSPAPCPLTHDGGDDTAGTPVCARCYDYTGHVLTSWWFPELWKRYVLTLRRLITRHSPGATVSFVKVMEMQTRLAPHYHAIIRITGPDDTAHHVTADTVVTLAMLAASHTRLEVPTPGGARVLRFGAQVDVQPIDTGDNARRVAGYLAKYVTKTITATPLPSQIATANIDTLPITDHHKTIMRTLARLADALPDEYSEMSRRLGTLGWRGHTTTKSRTYSTTMTAQKARRAAWRAEHVTHPTDPANTTEETEPVVWDYDRSGHKTRGHRYLAVTAALAHREQLRTAHTITDTSPSGTGEPAS